MQLSQRHQKGGEDISRLDAHAFISEGNCELALCQIGLSMLKVMFDVTGVPLSEAQDQSYSKTDPNHALRLICVAILKNPAGSSRQIKIYT